MVGIDVWLTYGGDRCMASDWGVSWHLESRSWIASDWVCELVPRIKVVGKLESLMLAKD